MTTNTLIYALHKVGLYGTLDRGRDYIALAKAGQRPSFSQFGEDLFLRNYFGERPGLYIEVGGNHPFNLSNTYLLYRMGWRGVVVEPIRRLYAKHKRFRPRDIQVNAAAGANTGALTFYEMIPSVFSTCDQHETERLVSKGSARIFHQYSVPVMTVAEIYHAHLAPHLISLISVDTEGHDMAVLRGIDWDTLHPEIIICEANDETKGVEISQYLAQWRYKCLRVLGCNRIFSSA